MTEVLDVSTMLPYQFEPIRNNLFYLSIEGIDAFLVKTTKKPSFKLGEIEIPWMNDKRYLQGRHEYETMSVVLYQAISPGGVQQVMEWVRTHHDTVSGRSGYAAMYKRDIQLRQVDPIGNVVGLTDIKGAFLTSVGFSDLDYSNVDAGEITLEIRFDKAVVQY